MKLRKSCEEPKVQIFARLHFKKKLQVLHSLKVKMLKEEKQALPVHMFAGMVAGGFTRLLVAPLDVLKIRFQVNFLIQIHFLMAKNSLW
jgi:hypothetical protein